MAHLSKLTDYGVLLIAQAARAKDRVISARQLADSTGIPLPTVSKVLKMLTKADLLETQRGALGGYRLARSPESISIAQVVEALEGAFALTDCAQDRDCVLREQCVTWPVWRLVNDQVIKSLSSVTLKDMVGQELVQIGDVH